MLVTPYFICNWFGLLGNYDKAFQITKCVSFIQQVLGGPHVTLQDSTPVGFKGVSICRAKILVYRLRAQKLKIVAPRQEQIATTTMRPWGNAL